LVCQDSIDGTEQLKKREWKGDSNYPLCEVKEEVNHIIFRRFVSLYGQRLKRPLAGVATQPASRISFQVGWKGSSKLNKLCLFGLGVVCWSLWKVCNKMVIEHKLVRSPRAVILISSYCCSNGRHFWIKEHAIVEATTKNRLRNKQLWR
jgi:hypothetical protein